MNNSITDILNKIQVHLKAPKGQFNSFGKYKYRSCEDILEAVKPLLENTVLLLSDEIVLIGDRYYIRATAKLKNEQSEIVATAYARESLTKKGMDDSQITGTASSYARKYALNGLFCIDDTKDADDESNNKGQSEPTKPTSEPTKPTEAEQEVLDDIAKALQAKHKDKIVDKDRLTAILYAISTRYPAPGTDIKAVLTWLKSKNKLPEILKEKTFEEQYNLEGESKKESKIPEMDENAQKMFDLIRATLVVKCPEGKKVNDERLQKAIFVVLKRYPTDENTMLMLQDKPEFKKLIKEGFVYDDDQTKGIA